MNKLIDLKSTVKVLAVIALIFTAFPKTGNAQNVFEDKLRVKLDSLRKEKELSFFGDITLLPNNAVSSVMTPSGWGGGNTTYIYVVGGGIFPAQYKDPSTGDLIAAAGISFGDPKKWVNVSASINVGRVDDFRDLSGNIILSRQIFKASSIAVGGLQVLASRSVSDAPDPTFYIAFSHAVQSVHSKTGGRSALGYTIGIGTGRFLYKSPLDVQTGKGKYGTGVFANVSYELFKNVNLNAEWSGLNLGISSGIRPFKRSALTFGYGVYNLTKNSGDRISFIGSLAYPFVLDKTVKQ
ncbi:MAG: hypothetical protein REI78_05420 [Pedobacter sp.]|nr:hypothetical protein [Pedobacter sp.]MDQ8052440.1 hypothetical protein [Pedobacter sp.]